MIQNNADRMINMYVRIMDRLEEHKKLNYQIICINVKPYGNIMDAKISHVFIETNRNK